MNDHDYQGNKEPTECPKCNSSMTQEKIGRYDILKCDNAQCAKVIELGNEYEADAKADHFSENQYEQV
jgi:ssDNA-binding Zn-finger/Zn-ribbon topoisomerase 1